MTNDKKKDLTNGIQKLSDDDIAQVSGGTTNVSGRNKDIHVTCCNCGNNRTLTFGSNFLPGGEFVQTANLRWQCEHCKIINVSQVQQHYLTSDDRAWSGTTVPE